MRPAGAPISWGVCEVPGWGAQLEPDRVLAEMAALGLTATELGPQGWLPEDADRHGLAILGGFVPLVAHGDQAAALEQARAGAATLAAVGADVLVAALVEDLAWSSPIPLDDDGWAGTGETLHAVAAVVGEEGLRLVVHPHAGTVLETAADVERALARTDVPWCLDTGHLLIGGTDPVGFARDNGARVGHLHLKDVDAGVAAQVRAGKLSLLEGTRAGLFRPLGEGDVDLGGVLRALEGYDGWVVLEQDVTLEPGADADPGAAVARSLSWLREATA